MKIQTDCSIVSAAESETRVQTINRYGPRINANVDIITIPNVLILLTVCGY